MSIQGSFKGEMQVRYRCTPTILGMQSDRCTPTSLGMQSDILDMGVA